jgi:hypothetical protein
MKKLQCLLTTVLLAASLSALATTWDEPWHDEVVREASHFVLAKVMSCDEEQGISIQIVKTLGGVPLSGQLEITDFYLLDICSTTGDHGPGFHFEGTRDCYFFLKQNDDGHYSIATPTTGFAKVEEAQVYATYRHSYHQALVPIDAYEATMTAIFKHHHQLAYDKKNIRKHIDKYLAWPPAGFDEGEIDLFFAQHVALETIYHLQLEGYFDQIMPFLNDTSNLHNPVSAARALTACDAKDATPALCTVLADTSRSDFLKVVCIYTLSRFRPVDHKGALVALEATASEEMNGFGGNIMDPRVCTHIPDVKAALGALLATL